MKRTLIWMMLLTFLLMLFALPVMATEAAQETRTAIDLTPVFQAVIALLAALVTGRLIPWIKSKTTIQQQAYLSSLVRTLVYAAEQLFSAVQGKEKLAYVEKGLLELGYSLDTSYISSLIESEVKWLKMQETDKDTSIEAREEKPPDDPDNPA